MPVEKITPTKIGFMTENGFQEIKPIGEITLEAEMVETTELEEIAHISNEFEVSLETDKGQIAELIKELQPKRGERIEMECSCICDGTLSFAIALIQELKKRGCANIKVTSEQVRNAKAPYEQTKFTARGVFWNTNNWRKMHHLPLIRRRGKRK